MLPRATRILVCTQPQDMRRSFDRLSSVVRDVLYPSAEGRWGSGEGGGAEDIGGESGLNLWACGGGGPMEGREFENTL